MSWRRAAASAACLTALAMPAAAGAADPLPPGAAKSTNLEYVDALPEAGRHHRGQVRRVRARTCWSSRGGSASRPTTSATRRSRSCSTSSCPGRPGRERLLAERGHGARHEAQADHRRARSSPHRRARRASPARPAAARANPDCRSGFYVISYGEPGRTASRSATSSSLPPATRRAASRTASTSGPAARRGVTTSCNLGPILSPDRRRRRTRSTASSATAGRSGSPICEPGQARRVRPADRHLAQRRLHGLLARRRRGRARASPGSAGRGGIRGYATVGQASRPVPEPRPQGLAVRPDPGRRRRRGWTTRRPGDDGTAQPVMLMHNSGRPTDGSVRPPASRRGNVLVGTEEDFTPPAAATAARSCCPT